MTELKYAKELGQVVEVRDSMTAEEALHLLGKELLGEGYYIVDPVGAKQANAIIVNEILKQYCPGKKKFLWFK